MADAAARDRPHPHLALAQNAEKALGPLHGLGQVAALHKRPAPHELLGLDEGPVHDGVYALLQADPCSFGGGGDATGGHDDASLGCLLDEPAHPLVQLGGRGLGRRLILVGQGVSQESHDRSVSLGWATIASL